MKEMLLTRSDRGPRPSVPVLGDITVPLARVHELCGPARRTLALLWARARPAAPVFWMQPEWQGEALHPAGLRQWGEPERFIWLRARREEDIFWSLEEALRAGVGGMVVGELSALPGLTAVRRLHLAAEAGARRGAPALAVLLTPGEGGAPGVETRWHMAVAPGASSSSGRPGAVADADADAAQADLRFWRLERRRARMAPCGGWMLEARLDARGARQVSALTPIPGGGAAAMSPA